MSNSSNWCHYNPVHITSAPMETLVKHVRGQHVLLVTTQGFVKRGVVQRVKDILSSCQVTVWDKVRPNPDLQDLEEAEQYYSGLGIECVVGLGGGSALDAAKVLSNTIDNTEGQKLRFVLRKNETPQWASRLPLVAVPTTSGTGAEVTPFATVWDRKENCKHSLSGDFVYPDVALLDPTLTLTLGKEDTLYPALDAISHALESIWNKNCTPVSLSYAVMALNLSKVALPQVIKEPQNLKARQDLQTASVLSGLAISQTRTAIAHGISYPLTVNFGLPHGLACSFTLKSLIEDNLEFFKEENNDLAILLTEVYQLLDKLELIKEVRRYVSSNQIIEMSGKMISIGRTENYRKDKNINLLDILNRSFSSNQEDRSILRVG